MRLEASLSGIFHLPRSRVSGKYRMICPGLNAIEIQIPCDKFHIVCSLVKVTKTHTFLSNMK